MTVRYQVIIMGAGPAGMFAALELARAGVEGILLAEKGPDLPDRKHLGRGVSMLSGWGPGAYSDGKLALSTEIGGFMGRCCTPTELAALEDYVAGRGTGNPEPTGAGGELGAHPSLRRRGEGLLPPASPQSLSGS